MVKVRNYKPTGEGLDEPAMALFQQQWQLYRKFVDKCIFGLFQLTYAINR